MKIIVILLVLWSINIKADISLMFDNDTFAKTDRYYTHGTKLSYQYNDINYSLIQLIYTPHNATVFDTSEHDRPYCGWLYFNLTKITQNNNDYRSWGLDIGTVGPNSYANETQTLVHKLINNRLPCWNNEIKNELGINILYNRKYKIYKNRWFDFIPSYNASIGNIHTYINIATSLRFGLIPDDFRTTKIEPTLRISPNFNNQYNIYTILMIEQRLVGRNISLDGNTFKSNNFDIHKNIFVSELSMGLGIIIHRFDLVYLYTIKTKEFKEQPNHSEYGSVQLNFKF